MWVGLLATKTIPQHQGHGTGRTKKVSILYQSARIKIIISIDV